MAYQWMSSDQWTPPTVVSQPSSSRPVQKPFFMALFGLGDALFMKRSAARPVVPIRLIVGPVVVRSVVGPVASSSHLRHRRVHGLLQELVLLHVLVLFFLANQPDAWIDPKRVRFHSLY